MKTIKQIWKRIALAGALLFIASCALTIWQKHDFCDGWADHYASRAKQCRADAENPGLTPNERREHLIAAEWHDVIAHKYSMAAHQPWRPYPRYPLITPAEKRIAATKY